MTATVCIFSPSENIWGGGQIYIDGLCRYLNECGVGALIVTSEPETFSSPTLRMASVRSKMRRLVEALRSARRLNELGVSVIVLNDLSSLWLAPVFRFYGFKVISLLHLYLQKRNEEGLGHSSLEYHLLRFSSRFAHRILSVNKDNEGSFPVKVEFIGNFVSPWFAKEPRTQEKKFDLGLIARLSVEKNVPLFIKLVAALNEIASRPVTALIVGKGPEEARVRSTILEFGMEHLIEMRNWVDRNELPAVYDQLRCFAITSHHEGFATTLLEAHARGVPAVCTRSSGYCPVFLKSHGQVTGISFDPEEINSEGFIRNVLELIEAAAHYEDACKLKACEFGEDRVLGGIRSVVSSLVNSSLNDRN